MLSQRSRAAGLSAVLLVAMALLSSPVRAATPDRYEPDNDFTTTNVMSSGDVQLHSLHSTSDRDFIKFTLPVASDIWIQTDSDISDADTILRLYDNAHNQIDYNDDRTGSYLSTITETNLPAGTYYASVEGNGYAQGRGQILDSYRLSLLTTPTGQSVAPIITSVASGSVVWARKGVSYAPFSCTISWVGPNATCSVSNLPTGLALRGNVIEGVPVSAGKISVTVTITSTASGKASSKTLVINVSDFGIIETKAGTGVSGDSGDGGLARAAQFRDVDDIATDKAGDLFVADYNGGHVRKVDPNGLINSIAGGGSWGSLNDGQPALNAVLSAFGVTVSPAGDILLADWNHNRICKIDATTGTISTLVGTGVAGFKDNCPAAQAQLSRPTAVAIDGSGNLLITDWGNNRVRKVSASTGQVSTIAGTGTAGFSGDGGNATQAQLNNPTDVKVDSNGNIFVADRYNHCIRKIDGSGRISTVAGTGATSGYTGDNGNATAARLNFPAAIAFDNSGNLLIGDTSNHVIRKVTTTTGVISTIAGNGTSGYSGDNGNPLNAALAYPWSLSVDAAGNIYVADFYNKTVRKIGGGVIQTVAGDGTSGYAGDGGVATAASLYDPSGLAFDSAGNILIMDYLSLRRVTLSNGIIDTIAGGGSPGDGGPATQAAMWPHNIATDTAGNVYVSDGYAIRKVDATTGVVSGYAGRGFNVVDNNLTVWFGDGENGPARKAMLGVVETLTVDGSGNLYFFDSTLYCVRMVSASTGTLTTIVGTGSYGDAPDGATAKGAPIGWVSALACDAAGNLYLCDEENYLVRKITKSTGKMTIVAGTGTYGFSGDGGPATNAEIDPWGIAIDKIGNIYISDYSDRVRMIDSSGTIDTVAGNGDSAFSGDGLAATQASLSFPTALALDGASPQNLFIADYSNDRIRQVGVVKGTSIANSPLTAAGKVGVLFSWRTVATGFPAPTFAATGLPAGLASLSDGTITGIPSASGAFDVLLTAVNRMGSDQKHLILTITKDGTNNAPTFANSSTTSELITVVPNPGTVNQTISFVSPTASDPDNQSIVYTWNFGDNATVVSGAPQANLASHSYTAPGLYAVQVSATDGQNQATASRMVAINPADVQADKFAIQKLGLKIDFKNKNKDSLSFAGAVPRRKSSGGKLVEVYIGDYYKKFTLSGNGSGKDATGTIKLTGNKNLDNAGVFLAAKFNVNIKNVSLSSYLNKINSSFASTTTTTTSIPLPIMVVLDGTDMYIQSVSTLFSVSKSGKGTGKRQNEGEGLTGR